MKGQAINLIEKTCFSYHVLMCVFLLSQCRALNEYLIIFLPLGTFGKVSGTYG